MVRAFTGSRAMARRQSSRRRMYVPSQGAEATGDAEAADTNGDGHAAAVDDDAMRPRERSSTEPDAQASERDGWSRRPSAARSAPPSPGEDEDVAQLAVLSPLLPHRKVEAIPAELVRASPRRYLRHGTALLAAAFAMRYLWRWIAGIAGASVILAVAHLAWAVITAVLKRTERSGRDSAESKRERAFELQLRRMQIDEVHPALLDDRVVDSGTCIAYRLLLTHPAASWEVWRRFSDFEALRKALLLRAADAEGPESRALRANHLERPLASAEAMAERARSVGAIPELEQRAAEQRDAALSDAGALAKRKDRLRRFLNAIWADPALAEAPEVRNFCGMPPFDPNASEGADVSNNPSGLALWAAAWSQLYALLSSVASAAVHEAKDVVQAATAGKPASSSPGEEATDARQPLKWADAGPDNSFQLRGKEYMTDRKKAFAGPARLSVVAADMFALKERLYHIATHGRCRDRVAELLQAKRKGRDDGEQQTQAGRREPAQAKAAAAAAAAKEGGDGARAPFLFILNIQVPGDPPVSIVIYFAYYGVEDEDDAAAATFHGMLERYIDIPGSVHKGFGWEAAAPGSSEGSTQLAASKSEQRLNATTSAARVQPKENGAMNGHAANHKAPLSNGSAASGEEEHESRAAVTAAPLTAPEPDGLLPSDDFRNERFKLIPKIAEGPFAVRAAVGSKPALLGRKLTQRYFRGPRYVETDVDVASSAVASNIVALCRGFARSLVVEMGICLEGRCADELPERCLGVVRLMRPDCQYAQDLE